MNSEGRRETQEDKRKRRVIQFGEKFMCLRERKNINSTIEPQKRRKDKIARGERENTGRQKRKENDTVGRDGKKSYIKETDTR